MKKYEFTGEPKQIGTLTLHRIRAIIDFGAIKAGDLGGWIEKEENLSHEGDAWVSGNAQVYGNAWVYGDAWVHGDAWVYGEADYTTIKGFGTRFRTTTFFRCRDKTVKVACGCFLGTIAEFREQVKKTRTGKVAEEYLMIADLMEKHFETEE